MAAVEPKVYIGCTSIPGMVYVGRNNVNKCIFLYARIMIPKLSTHTAVITSTWHHFRSNGGFRSLPLRLKHDETMSVCTAAAIAVCAVW